MTGPKPPYTPVEGYPGMYTDADGAVILNAADILIALEIEDTPANREWPLTQLMQEAGVVFPDATFVRKPGDPIWQPSREKESEEEWKRLEP